MATSQAQRISTTSADAIQAATRSLTSQTASQIAEVRSDLRVLEHRMTMKLGGIVVAAVAVLGAFLRLFPGGHP